MGGQFIGVDTSCYTTSFACVDEKSIVSDRRTVLSVASGERGLRQSDGVFQHVRNASALLPAMMGDVCRREVRCVGVSVRPRPEPDSCMPVFLAGKAAAVARADGLGVAVMEFSHREGHVRAALMGNEALMDKPFLGMHLSGGTTEIFSVAPGMAITLLGGTEDLHAGQLVDRAGVAMGLPFPCGKHLEALAGEFHGALSIKLRSSVKGAVCSFSGMESAVQRGLACGWDHRETAFAIYDGMASTFCKMLEAAREQTSLDCALIAGGVASSPMLRAMMGERMQKRGSVALFFGESRLSGDNAVGAALLARDAWRRRNP